VTAGSAPARAADRARTIFLGSGTFAVPILDAVAAHPRLHVVGVVTAPDRPAGRSRTMTPTPVAVRAAALGLPVLRPASVRAPDALADLAALQPDIGVLADYGRIIPRALLDLPAHGILGVHPSRLPRHRGATPIEATIREGDPEAAVTIYRMDEGLDTGPIVDVISWPLDGTETGPSLQSDAAARAAARLAIVLPAYLDGEAVPVAQGATTSAVTTRLTRADASLDPARPAADLERQVRAHAGWPGAAVDTAAGRLVILEASVAPRAAAAEDDPGPGTVVDVEGRPALVAGDGRRLVLERVQPAGGRPMSGAEFLRGRRGLLGTTVAAPATVSAR
jgi:methionyl-tRNA formyltransferase